MAKKIETAEQDQIVMDLLKSVDIKRKQIQKAKTRPNWKTNCTFGKDPSIPERINIQTVKDTRKLLEIFAFLQNQEKSLEQAANYLGVDFEGTWQNYSFQDWKDDIQARVDQILLEKKEKELEELNIRVNNLVTPEQRRTMELEVLKNLLK
jgi:hypothetical protein